MSRTMMIGATGMEAQAKAVEVISNNIANIRTTGFKAQRPEFQDLMYQNLRRPGTESNETGTIVPTGIQLGGGVKIGATYRMHSQGDVQATDNPFDIAIIGKGFFQVEMPDGTTAYTRAGSFQVNQDGIVVNPDGYPILPQITVPPDAVEVTINASGQVFAKIQGTVDPTNLGQLQLANFVNPPGLEAIGDNLLTETPASGAPVLTNPNTDGAGRLLQNSLEGANVNIVKEITSLINAQRAYEMNSRVIRAGDEMANTLTQMR